MMADDRDILWPSLLQRLTDEQDGDTGPVMSSFAGIETVEDQLRDSIEQLVKVPHVQQAHLQGNQRDRDEPYAKPADGRTYDHESAAAFEKRVKSSVLNYGIPAIAGTVEGIAADDFQSKMQNAVCSFEPRIASFRDRKQRHKLKDVVVVWPNTESGKRFTPKSSVKVDINMDLRSFDSMNDGIGVEANVDVVNGRARFRG